MPVRKEDEIMADYLLKGGKMLEKPCSTCGCPLFEVKGKTLCVVCEEQASPGAGQGGADAGGSAPLAARTPAAARGGVTDLAGRIAEIMALLCDRIRDEKDPENVLVLMSAVKSGAEALSILSHG